MMISIYKRILTLMILGFFALSTGCGASSAGGSSISGGGIDTGSFTGDGPVSLDLPIAKDSNAGIKDVTFTPDVDISGIVGHIDFYSTDGTCDEAQVQMNRATVDTVSANSDTPCKYTYNFPTEYLGTALAIAIDTGENGDTGEPAYLQITANNSNPLIEDDYILTEYATNAYNLGQSYIPISIQKVVIDTTADEPVAETAILYAATSEDGEEALLARRFSDNYEIRIDDPAVSPILSHINRFQAANGKVAMLDNDNNFYFFDGTTLAKHELSITLDSNSLLSIDESGRRIAMTSSTGYVGIIDAGNSFAYVPIAADLTNYTFNGGLPTISFINQFAVFAVGKRDSTHYFAVLDVSIPIAEAGDATADLIYSNSLPIYNARGIERSGVALCPVDDSGHYGICRIDDEGQTVIVTPPANHTITTFDTSIAKAGYLVFAAQPGTKTEADADTDHAESIVGYYNIMQGGSAVYFDFGYNPIFANTAVADEFKVAYIHNIYIPNIGEVPQVAKARLNILKGLTSQYTAISLYEDGTQDRSTGQSFNAGTYMTGGCWPRTYVETTTTDGTVDSITGYAIAPSTAGTFTVQATDCAGNTVSQSFTVSEGEGGSPTTYDLSQAIFDITGMGSAACNNVTDCDTFAERTQMGFGSGVDLIKIGTTDGGLTNWTNATVDSTHIPVYPISCVDGTVTGAALDLTYTENKEQFPAERVNQINISNGTDSFDYGCYKIVWGGADGSNAPVANTSGDDAAFDNGAPLVNTIFFELEAPTYALSGLRVDGGAGIDNGVCGDPFSCDTFAERGNTEDDPHDNTVLNYGGAPGDVIDLRIATNSSGTSWDPSTLTSAYIPIYKVSCADGTRLGAPMDVTYTSGESPLPAPLNSYDYNMANLIVVTDDDGVDQFGVGCYEIVFGPDADHLPVATNSHGDILMDTDTSARSLFFEYQ